MTNVSHNSVDISWKEPSSDGGTPILGYIVEIKENRRSYWNKIGKVDSDTFKYSVHDLLEGNTYYIRVSAFNEEGKGETLQGDSISPKKKNGKIYSNIHI